MAWTTPKTDWAVGELVSASDMNTVGENLAALKQPATAVGTTTAEIEMQSADYVDVDGGALNLSITTTGGDVLAHFHGALIRRSSDRDCFLDIDVDGNRQGGDASILQTRVDSRWRAASFTYLIRNLSAGAHTIKLQWKTDHSVGIKLQAGAQFWVREI